MFPLMAFIFCCLMFLYGLTLRPPVWVVILQIICILITMPGAIDFFQGVS